MNARAPRGLGTILAGYSHAVVAACAQLVTSEHEAQGNTCVPTS